MVIITGGLGLAPLRPALYALFAKRERYGNITLVYGARTPQDLLYTREFEQWRGRFGVNLHVTVDSATKRMVGARWCRDDTLSSDSTRSAPYHRFCVRP